MSDSNNPFTAAKVLGVGVSSFDYIHYNEKPRGHPEFVMSRSELVRFNACPRKWILGEKDDDTDATEFGSLVDCLLLSPKSFDDQFVVRPETYPAPADHAKVKKGLIPAGSPLPWNANAGYCDTWEQGQEGLTIIKPKDFQGAQDAIKRLMAEPLTAEIIECSKTQVLAVAEYHDPETKIVVPFKVLIDLAPDSKHPKFGQFLIDLKTTRSAALEVWRKFVYEHSYHTQAAAHLDVLVAATGQDRNSFGHLLVENVAPWEPARRLLSTEYLELGRMAYVSALRKYCRCQAEKNFPGYDAEAKFVAGWPITEPKPWMGTAAMEQMYGPA